MKRLEPHSRVRVKVIEYCIEALENEWDCGPIGEGWHSDEREEIISELSAILRRRKTK